MIELESMPGIIIGTCAYQVIHMVTNKGRGGIPCQGWQIVFIHLLSS